MRILTVLAAAEVGVSLFGCNGKPCTAKVGEATTSGVLTVQESKDAAIARDELERDSSIADPNAPRTNVASTAITFDVSAFQTDVVCDVRDDPCIRIYADTLPRVVVSFRDPHGLGHFDLADLHATVCDGEDDPCLDDGDRRNRIDAGLPDCTYTVSSCTPLAGTLDIDAYAPPCPNNPDSACLSFDARLVIDAPASGTTPDGPVASGAITLHHADVMQEAGCGGGGFAGPGQL
jgi:hypothetical protein